MRIRRTFKNEGGEIKVSVELTPDEEEAIYRKVQHDIRVEDAKSHLYDAIGYSEYKDDEVQADVLQKFESKYGFSLSDAVNEGSDNYLLELLVHKYEKSIDRNVAENDLWDGVVEVMLQKLEG